MRSNTLWRMSKGEIEMKTRVVSLIMTVFLACFLGGMGSTTADDYLTIVYTPNETAILAWVMEEMSQEQIDSINTMVESDFPNATRKSDASRTYNCHSYAWHISGGGNTVWINDPSMYWEDGSYVYVENESEADKISYGSADHSAITTDKSEWFKSKWGQGPLMYHAADDCPYDASALTYYKRDNPAASVNGFSVVNGYADWKTSSEYMTACYVIEGSEGREGQWTQVGPDEPSGAGWHSVDVSWAAYSCFRLIEIETGGKRIMHCMTRPGKRGNIEEPHKTKLAVLKEKFAKLMIDQREQNSLKYRYAGTGQTCVIFTPDSLSIEVEQYVADYWRNTWGYNIIVETIDGYPSHPDDFRSALKAAIANHAASGAFYFHLIGDANDWREFDGELTPSLWVDDWEQIRQSYLASGYPAGGQPEKDIIPTYIFPDTLPRYLNTSFYTPYIFSDLPYADTDDDDIPDVVVTRWPVNSAADVMRLAYKMQVYHDGYDPGCQLFKEGFLVGDLDHDGIGDGPYARVIADGIEAALPSGQDVVHLYESDFPFDVDRNYAAADLWNNELPELLIILSSYSNRSWPGNFFDQTSGSNPFQMGMIESYLNHTPMVIAGSCGGGDYARTEDPDYGTPILEKFLFEEDKGAVAWLGPSVGSWQGGNDAVVRYTVEEIFADPSRPLAESWLIAMQRVFADYPNNVSILRTASAYVFLGDPLSRLCHVNIPTGEREDESPYRSLILEQNAPNPFNPTTRISFTTTWAGRVSVRIYNSAGILIKTLMDKKLPAGKYTVDWHGRNNAGEDVASGVYFYRLLTAEGTRTKKMILLR